VEPMMPREILDAVLGELHELAAATPVEPRAGELLRRLRADRLRIAVLGEAKRGKSTLINALLGRQVLPTGVVPLTALATTLVHARRERVETVGPGGRRETHPLSALTDLVTEAGNPRNRRAVSEVTVYLDSPILTGGIELIDTPGTGSVHTHNTEQAERALGVMDAAVFVLCADPPVSAAELELIARVDAASVATFVLLNKSDRLDAAELAQAEAFTADTIRTRLGRGLRIYPCSARTALREGSDPGLDVFLGDLTAYLAEGQAAGLERSLARHARELAEALRDQVRVTLRADALGAEAEAGRVRAFRECLDNLALRCEEACDLARAQVGHLIDEMNLDAQRAAASTCAPTGTRLEAWLASEGAALPVAQSEQHGSELVLAWATRTAEAWRAERSEHLANAVAGLRERLADGFARDLAAVREAARDLLGLKLSIAATDIELTADPRFHYAPPDPHGPAGMLASAVRTRIPGPAARHRVQRRLLASVPEALDRQTGRARASLQQRMTKTLTALLAALAERYNQYRQGLEAALIAAETTGSLGAAETASRRAEFEAHDRQLCTVIDQVAVLCQDRGVSLVEVEAR